MITFEVDTSALDLELPRAEKDLDEELHKAGHDAAVEGVKAAKATHPYTDRTHDLTDDSNVQPNHVEGGGLMTWPEEYASYVDKGTSRAKAYPFTPLAEQVADRELEDRAQRAVDHFCARLSAL